MTPVTCQLSSLDTIINFFFLTPFNLYGLVISFTSQRQIVYWWLTILFLNSALLASAISVSEQIKKKNEEKNIILETLQWGARKQCTDKCSCLEQNR